MKLEKKDVHVFAACKGVTTVTDYRENGMIRIKTVPVSYVPPLHRLGEELVQRGKMHTEPGGDCLFVPSYLDAYKGGNPRYVYLYHTRWTKVRETKRELVVEMRFPRHWDNAKLVAEMQAHVREVAKVVYKLPHPTKKARQAMKKGGRR